MICLAISYGALVWHKLSNADKAPKGPAAKFRVHQNSGLRKVLGAFRATPIRQLETEAFTTPLDLWLNGRVARFQARLERTGIAKQIQDACAAIRTRLRARRRRTTLSPGLVCKQ